MSVFGHPEFAGQVVIDDWGNVRLPFIGRVHAAATTIAELEGRIAEALSKGFVQDPIVTVIVAEYRPIYIFGAVRSPGSFAYRHGMSVLGAIAQAGGIGAAETSAGALTVELLQGEERVRLLESQRAAASVRRARIVAQLNGADQIDLQPDDIKTIDSARLKDVKENEDRIFHAEKRAQEQELKALKAQIGTLKSLLTSLDSQQKLEQKQRDLNHQMVESYEQMKDTGLIRRPNYIEVKREEARIDANIERLRSDVLRANQSLGDVQLRIEQLQNSYQRRLMSELQAADQTLLELASALPAALRIRSVRALQLGMLDAETAADPAITLIRGGEKTTLSFASAGNFRIFPGDVVQVGAATPNIGATRKSASHLGVQAAQRDCSLAIRAVLGAPVPLHRLLRTCCTDRRELRRGDRRPDGRDLVLDARRRRNRLFHALPGEAPRTVRPPACVGWDGAPPGILDPDPVRRRARAVG